MIRDKNIFTCLWEEDEICFPNHTLWSPPSYGHQRRSFIFSQAFPNRKSTILSKQYWEQKKRENPDKIRIFRYNTKHKHLTEIEKHQFFTNDAGNTIFVGDTVHLEGKIYRIRELKMVSGQGLLALCAHRFKEKNINLSYCSHDGEKNHWIP